MGTVGRIAFPGVMDTVALAAAAAVTSRFELLSHVLLAPVWPPVLLAKEAAGASFDLARAATQTAFEAPPKRPEPARRRPCAPRCPRHAAFS
ncbi:hypothetical protein [Amycolatopsis acidicola]|uniref:hypothetical protein n=1 Tax=Amycolatopsis acidicola TaxID=2596893 RepID=UPI001FB81501|nr:hypothetical protein [Amycolatopsis acidicola]